MHMRVRPSDAAHTDVYSERLIHGTPSLEFYTVEEGDQGWGGDLVAIFPSRSRAEQYVATMNSGAAKPDSRNIGASIGFWREGRADEKHGVMPPDTLGVVVEDWHWARIGSGDHAWVLTVRENNGDLALLRLVGEGCYFEQTAFYSQQPAPAPAPTPAEQPFKPGDLVIHRSNEDRIMVVVNGRAAKTNMVLCEWLAMTGQPIRAEFEPCVLRKVT